MRRAGALTMNRMRVCMMLERDAHLERDGRVRREVHALRRAGHEVVVLHAGPPDPPAVLAAEGGTWRSVRRRGARELTARLPGGLRRLAIWSGFVRGAVRTRPDAVHAHDVSMLAPAWLAARLTRAALVYDTHEYARGVPYHSRLARLFVRSIQTLLVPRAAGVIAVSSQTAAHLEHDHRLKQPPTVLRNIPVVDWSHSPARLARVIPLRAELAIGDAPLILHQGYAGTARGCEQLVNAICDLKGAHLVFLGDLEPGYGPLLRRLAAEGGAADRVHLVPSVELEVLLEHTSQADVGVCLFDPRWMNHRLTLQNKLFEYITAGIPVVAVSDTAFGSLVEHFGVGVTATFGEHDELVEAIATLLRRRTDAQLRRRLELAARELSWNGEQRRLVELYERIGAARASAR